MRRDGVACCKSWFGAQSRFLKDSCCCSLFFSPRHQPKFTSSELEGKIFLRETWSSAGFSARQCCVPSVSYSVSLVFPSYKNNGIFSFAPCLLCLFKSKNYLFRQATKCKISSLEVELGSKQAQGVCGGVGYKCVCAYFVGFKMT